MYASQPASQDWRMRYWGQDTRSNRSWTWLSSGCDGRLWAVGTGDLR